MGQAAARWRPCRAYVDNVAHAVVLAAASSRAAGRVYNVAALSAPSEREWVEAIAAVIGWRGEIVLRPEAELPPHLWFDGDPSQDLVLDTSRIRSELGYAEPVAFQAGLERTVAWHESNPGTDVPSSLEYAAEDRVLGLAPRGNGPPEAAPISGDQRRTVR
jgi:nucleoside-diphosphate-sugar epimerase